MVGILDFHKYQINHPQFMINSISFSYLIIVGTFLITTQYTKWDHIRVQGWDALNVVCISKPQMAPSHYLSRCWLIVDRVHWYSFKTNLAGSSQYINSLISFKNKLIKLLPHLSEANESRLAKTVKEAYGHLIPIRQFASKFEQFVTLPQHHCHCS